MPTTVSSRTRRRTNSFAGVSDFSVKRKSSISLQRPATEESNLLALSELPKPTRYRRSSFALSGERYTPLDSLVQTAASHITHAAATREAAKISCIVSPPSEAVEFEGGNCSSVNTDSDESQRKLSVITLLPKPKQLVSTSLACASHSGSDQWRGGSIHNSKENLFASGHQNPLSSELVRNYLAMVTAEHPSPQPEAQSSLSSRSSSSVASANMPGFINLDTPSVASMTIPVYQIRRAYANNMRPSAPPTHSTERNAWTDVNYSSGVSDAELWPTSGNRVLDYQSDNYVRDAASEAKLLRMTGQRLEADYHRSTSSLPRSKRIRSRSKTSITPLDPQSSATSPPSVHSSKFDLIHVYEGLPVSFTASTASSIASSPASHHPCPTPPSSPSLVRNIVQANEHSLGQGNKLGRLRSLFDQLKPQVVDDDSKNYIYLDQKTQERRVKAQASNVIAPVSF